MEDLGTTEIQNFHLAHHARPRLDLGQTGPSWVGSQPLLPLCRTTVETSLHLTSECWYTRRIWDLVANWTAQPGLRPSNWRPSNTTLEWWNNITTTPAIPRKAVRTLTMLILWEIWKERNSRVFQRQESSALSLFAKIKNKATAWTQAGASRFASFLMRE